MTLVGIAAVVLVGWGTWSSHPETTPAPAPIATQRDPKPEPVEIDAIADGTSEPTARSTIAPVPAGTSLPAIRADQLRAVVVDELTGEPLPQYILRFWFDTTSADVTSDDTGTVVVDVPPGSRSIDVHCIDLPMFHDRKIRETDSKVLKIDLPASEDPLVLRAPAGPTYRLRFEPDDVEAPYQLNAALYATRKTDRGTQSFSSAETPVRDGPPAWVRFSPRTATASYAEYLQVMSRDGLWTGRVRASATRGIVPEVLLVRLEPHSSINITVLDAAGAPIQGAEVGLQKRSDRRNPYYGQMSDKNGWCAYVRQDPGPAIVRARHLRYEPNQIDVDLEPGKFANARVVLQPLQLAGAIAGAIVSDSGTYAPQMRVRLTPIDPPGLVLETQPAWSGEEGAKRGAFLFDALPNGLYRLEFVRQDYFEWSPQEMELRPPRSDLVVTVHDKPTVALGFRLRHARTGEVVTGARACFRLGLKNEASPYNFVTEGQPTLVGIPVGVPVDWLVDAPGFQPARGNVDSFTIEQELGRVRGLVAEVSLEPGWGRPYRVMREGSNEPIAGARFLVDGVHVTTSDASGFAEIVLDKVPQRVEVEIEGWSMTLPARVRLAPNNGPTMLWTRIDLAPVAR